MSLHGFLSRSLLELLHRTSPLEGSPLGKWTSSDFTVSAAQMSPLGVAMIPCNWPSSPLKLYPSGGESGLPVLSKTEMVLLPAKLATHTLEFASMATPNPGPASPPPVKPVSAGDSGVPLGANFEMLPAQYESWACAPTWKLSAVQTLPSLSNISLPPA